MNDDTASKAEVAAEVEAIEQAEVGQPKPRAKAKPAQDPGDDAGISSKPVDDAEPAADPQPQPQSDTTPHAATPVYQAAVTGDKDDVYLSNCIVKNPANRKSLTIHHLQRRLWELGFTSAADDKDGYYGDLTIDSVMAFQEANGLEGTGIVDQETFLAIFENDPIVVTHD